MVALGGGAARPVLGEQAKPGRSALGSALADSLGEAVRLPVGSAAVGVALAVGSVLATPGVRLGSRLAVEAAGEDALVQPPRIAAAMTAMTAERLRRVSSVIGRSSWALVCVSRSVYGWYPCAPRAIGTPASLRAHGADPPSKQPLLGGVVGERQCPAVCVAGLVSAAEATQGLGAGRGGQGGTVAAGGPASP